MESIVSWLPVKLVCILFGPSMVYHVFLLSGIREHYDETHDNEGSLAFGVQSTGRIITGAALTMVPYSPPSPAPSSSMSSRWESVLDSRSSSTPA